MERFCDVSPTSGTLTVQYRMHKSIQDVVSMLSYDGLLRMGDIERTRKSALIWHESEMDEENVRVSFQNRGEARVCEGVYERERKKHPRQTIRIIVRCRGVFLFTHGFRDVLLWERFPIGSTRAKQRVGYFTCSP